MMIYRIYLFAFVMVVSAGLGAGSAKAADQLESYTPPPLFGAPEPAKVRPEKPLIVKPAVSPVVDYETAPPPPDIRPSIQEKKSAPRVIDVPAAEKKPAAPGVVKGPVEMPPTPASKVETITVETPSGPMAENAGKTMLETHQERIKAQQDAAPSSPLPAGGSDIAPFSLSLPFQPGTTTLTPEHTKMLEAKVLPAMAAGGNLRLQILSFATATDDSQSGDRRIALNRALSVRAALLAKGIPAERIDVRALGDQSDSAPKDRTDLVLLR
jgi:outer membrane protein OmpA-like peptidoglycan-associated protein